MQRGSSCAVVFCPSFDFALPAFHIRHLIVTPHYLEGEASANRTSGSVTYNPGDQSLYLLPIFCTSLFKLAPWRTNGLTTTSPFSSTSMLFLRLIFTSTIEVFRATGPGWPAAPRLL